MKKKINARQIITIGVLMVAGACLGFFFGRIGSTASYALPGSTLVMLAVLFIPAFCVVIGFHEAGHALAGEMMKFDFRMYVVGPFMWEKEQNGWKFKWNRNVNLFGGMVICLPVGSEDLSKRFSIYSVGGPLASLLLAGLGYGIYHLTSMDGLGHFFLMTSLLSFIIFLVTALPMHMGGFFSDGARAIRLLGGGDTARFEVLILKLIADTTSGTRPKALAMEALEEASILAKKLNAPFGVYLHGYLHQAAFDKGDLVAAEKHLLDYIREADLIPDGIRNAVWLDGAFFYAYAKRDIAQASYYWRQFKPSAIVAKAQVLATEAAISVIKNESMIAHHKIAAAISELPNMMDKGTAVALKEKLNLMTDFLRSQELKA